MKGQGEFSIYHYVIEIMINIGLFLNLFLLQIHCSGRKVTFFSQKTRDIKGIKSSGNMERGQIQIHTVGL
jgi:hypothetical protein